MKIKDIVNRDIVNLTNCDQEPIHIPGSIQPHGFLIAFDENFSIEFCSENIEQFISLQPTQILKKTLSAAFGRSVAQEMIAYAQSLTGSVTAPLVVELSQKKFNCSINKNAGYWIAELEEQEKDAPKISMLFDQTVQFVRYMQQSQTLQQLCSHVADEIRGLTGYDRVMVYRFDKDYNGEVYAESRDENVEPFFGLHYPHTDIPVQARQLYIKNLLRLIVDVNYTPVPILTIDDGQNKNLDMSFCALRSVSPIHVQYLQNMGVGATLTISLLHEEKLWGLIACHHYSPKFIDQYTRINARLQGHFLTSQIDIRQTAEEYAVSEQVNASMKLLLNDNMVLDRNSLSEIAGRQELLNVCNAAGVAILLDGTIYKNGRTPNDEDILRISNWAQHNKSLDVYSTSKLSHEMPNTHDCEDASGIIFYGLSGVSASAIIWFRPETKEEVRWAGEPEKAIIKDEKGLHPRKSFETWKQVIKCQAQPWKKPELAAAANFAYALQKHITVLLLTEEGIRQQALSKELKETNAELENINWISTHDLQEPLRKIQMFTSRLMSRDKELSTETNTTIKKVSDSAQRMQKLIEDLMSYAKLRQSQSGFQDVDLQLLVAEIEADMQEDLSEQQASIHIARPLPSVSGIPVLLRELFANLFRNSLKFRKDDVAPLISIDYQSDAHFPNNNNGLFHHITVRDNGIGFDEKFNEEVFKIFIRLSDKPTKKGSGVGLSLCKKIMQIHNGYITAEGKLEKGATFHLFFPQ